MDPEPFQTQNTVEDNHSLLMRAPANCARENKLLITAMLAVQSLLSTPPCSKMVFSASNGIG